MGNPIGKNPLYVVSSKDKVVEPAHGLWEYFIKRFELQGVENFFLACFQYLYKLLPNFQGLINFLNDLLSRLGLSNMAVEPEASTQ